MKLIIKGSNPEEMQKIVILLQNSNAEITIEDGNSDQTLVTALEDHTKAIMALLNSSVLEDHTKAMKGLQNGVLEDHTKAMNKLPDGLYDFVETVRKFNLSAEDLTEAIKRFNSDHHH